MFGFLNVNKPAGPTSHDVVARVRRLLPRKTKVGHAGTLDPFAEGVLVVCIGPATRLADYARTAPKRYRAAVTLGAASTTEDPTGQITATPDAAPPDAPTVAAALAEFVGDLQQVPPAHSAVHVAGRRAYKLAREGRDLDLPPRPVTITALDLLAYDWPLLEIDVGCETGAYIRSLARDIGSALGVGGYCSQLTRTAVGPFALADAVALDDLTPTTLPARLLGPLTALSHLPRITVAPAAARRLAMGQSVLLPADAPTPPPATEIAILDAAGQLLALANPNPDGRSLQPTKVFCASP